MTIVAEVVESRVCLMRRRSRISQWQALERDEICLEKDSVESNLKPRSLADRLDIMGLLVGREREGLTILEVC